MSETQINRHALALYRQIFIGPEERAANFGLVGAAFGIGFAIGPAIGGMLSFGI